MVDVCVSINVLLSVAAVFNAKLAKANIAILLLQFQVPNKEKLYWYSLDTHLTED